MSNLDSIFKKKSGKAKKPTTLNVQSVAAALEPKYQNGSSGKNSAKDVDDDDEWISVKDKKKVIANVTGKSMETYVQEMVEEEIDLASKIKIEETRNLLQSVRERNIQILKDKAATEAATASSDPPPPAPSSKPAVWKPSIARLAAKKIPEKEDFPTLESTFKTDSISKPKGFGEKPKESPTSIWELPSMESTRKVDDNTSSNEVSSLATISSIDNQVEVTVLSGEGTKDAPDQVNTNTNTSNVDTISEQPTLDIAEKLNITEATTTLNTEEVATVATTTATTAIISESTTTTITAPTDKTVESSEGVSTTEVTSSEELPVPTRKPKKKKGVFMEV